MIPIIIPQFLNWFHSRLKSTHTSTDAFPIEFHEFSQSTIELLSPLLREIFSIPNKNSPKVLPLKFFIEKEISMKFPTIKENSTFVQDFLLKHYVFPTEDSVLRSSSSQNFGAKSEFLGDFFESLFGINLSKIDDRLPVITAPIQEIMTSYSIIINNSAWLIEIVEKSQEVFSANQILSILFECVPSDFLFGVNSENNPENVRSIWNEMWGRWKVVYRSITGSFWTRERTLKFLRGFLAGISCRKQIPKIPMS